MEYSKTIQSLTEKEVQLILSLHDKRTFSAKCRSALLFRHKTGHSIGTSARLFNYDRIALSAAEKKVLEQFKAIQDFFGLSNEQTVQKITFDC